MTDKTKDWVSCPKCRRRIFRGRGDGTVEVAPGAKVMHPMDRNTAGEWVPRVDEVAIAQCPRGHMAGPPQEPPFS
ncbi:MAG TPA: hypothetical protein VIQ02_17415 [Jiangellaceae bacterium]